ncbi:hypothetical protein EZS27_005047 [termite gut metagenome]|uniref:Uncharacterized protein n=1 Tax=termite gut metagenome TaxID=433724 RepID=A0A5J4SNY1_9ZZZZ
MKKIFIDKRITGLSKEYANNLFSQRKTNFQKPKANLQALEVDLRKDSTLTKYANYVKTIIDKYSLLNSMQPQDFENLAKSDFCGLSEVDLKEKFVKNNKKRKIVKNKRGKEFHNYIVEAMRYDEARKEILPYIRKLGIKACCYCNAQLAITTEENNGKISGKYELDHFYPKSKYPFLCTSFFNLQPSCAHCNKSKGDKKAKFGLYTTKYEKINPFTFSLEKESIIKYMLKQDCEELKISFYSDDSDLKKDHEDKFHISALYETQKDVAEEIIWKSRIYNKSYRKSLSESFSKLFSAKTNFNRFILGNYDDSKDIHKRPMAKLVQDIARQLGII